jgi:hypothetical protein
MCSLVDCGPIPSRRSSPGTRFQKIRLLGILVGTGQEGIGSATAMAHEIAKLLLEYAGSFAERTEAIKVAQGLGMPLHEIQDYLDWLDATKPLRTEGAKDKIGHGRAP